MSIPLVSVCMIAYNHENYIAEAIKGVFMQQTDFMVEFIISNDASLDGTDKIINGLAKDSDKIKIKYFSHSDNKGMIPNFIWSLRECKGKYIALCEGDDYWTDPLKLQKQVDFMEGNPEYAICFHSVAVYDESLKAITTDNITRHVPQTTSIVDMARGNYIHTPSVLLRNDFNIPKWFKKATLGDWTLYLIAIKNRKIKKMTDSMAVYRLHEKSIWSNKDQSERSALTKETVRLVYNNLKIKNKKAKNILRKRAGYKLSRFQRILNKMKKIYK